MVDQLATADKVADLNVATRRRWPLDTAKRNKLVYQLTRTRPVNLRPHRAADLYIARAGTKPLDPLDNIGQRVDALRLTSDPVLSSVM